MCNFFWNCYTFLTVLPDSATAFSFFLPLGRSDPPEWAFLQRAHSGAQRKPAPLRKTGAWRGAASYAPHNNRVCRPKADAKSVPGRALPRFSSKGPLPLAAPARQPPKSPNLPPKAKLTFPADLCIVLNCMMDFSSQNPSCVENKNIDLQKRRSKWTLTVTVSFCNW